MKPPELWLGKHPIVDPEHHADLEARAAVHEFRGHLPREEAEEKAYQDYRKERALDAAAHHLLGIRAAHASGHDEAARQHGAQYVAAMKVAGEDPAVHPPDSVLNRVRDIKHKVYSFKAHPADHLFPVQEPEEVQKSEEPEEDLQKKVDSLRALLEKLED